MNALIKQNKRLTQSMGNILDKPHRTSPYTTIHAVTVSLSLLRLTSLLLECGEAPEAVLWPFTLMSLIGDPASPGMAPCFYC